MKVEAGEVGLRAHAASVLVQVEIQAAYHTSALALQQVITTFTDNVTHASRAWELVVETTTQPLLFELALPSPPPSASMQPSLPPTPLLPLPRRHHCRRRRRRRCLHRHLSSSLDGPLYVTDRFVTCGAAEVWTKCDEGRPRCGRGADEVRTKRGQAQTRCAGG